jgi:hypothetical protein
MDATVVGLQNRADLLADPQRRVTAFGQEMTVISTDRDAQDPFRLAVERWIGSALFHGANSLRRGRTTLFDPAGNALCLDGFSGRTRLALHLAAQLILVMPRIALDFAGVIAQGLDCSIALGDLASARLEVVKPRRHRSSLTRDHFIAASDGPLGRRSVVFDRRTEGQCFLARCRFRMTLSRRRIDARPLELAGNRCPSGDQDGISAPANRSADDDQRSHRCNHSDEQRRQYRHPCRIPRASRAVKPDDRYTPPPESGGARDVEK